MPGAASCNLGSLPPLDRLQHIHLAGAFPQQGRPIAAVHPT